MPNHVARTYTRTTPMASYSELRPNARPATAGRSGMAILGRIAVPGGLLAVGVLCALLLVFGGGGRSHEAQRSVPSFLAKALGAPKPNAPLARQPARGVHVAITGRGAIVRRGGDTLSIDAVGAGSAPWTRHDGGTSRPTPFGSEAIRIAPETTEEFLTVNQRQGMRTWQWRLASSTLEPRLSVDGSIELRAETRIAGLRVLPVQIFDAAGGDVTPGGARWKLTRSGRDWLLSLRLDDSELPVPYVIDPAANYPSPLYLSSTASAVTNSWKLVTAAPSAANSTTNTEDCKNCTDYVQFQPGVLNTTAAAPALNGRGWLADFGANNGATGFPTGNWSFTVTTDPPGAQTGGTAVLAVGMWKGTIAGGVFTSTGTVLSPTDDPAAQDLLRNGTNPVVTTATFNVAAFSLAANETILVELFRHQTTGNGSGNASHRQLTLTVNDGVALITHPAADDVAPTHSLSLTPVTGGSYLNTSTNTIYYRGSAVGSFTLSDTVNDGAGSGANSVTYPAIGTANWTHNVETVSTGPSFTSSTFSWNIANPANPTSKNITGNDKALNAATPNPLTVSFVSDTQAPGQPSLALNGGPYYTSLSVGLTPTDAADVGGSGLKTSSRAYERDEVALSNNACGVFPGSWSSVTLTAGADTTVQSGKCYRYRYTVADNVGNVSPASASTATAKVDNVKPTFSSPNFTFSSLTATASNGSDTIWYRPSAASGSFTVAGNASDPETLVSSYTYPALAGWTRTLFGTTATYSHTGSPSDPVEPNNVTATDTAGNVSNAVSFTVTPDGNAPTGMTASITGGYYTSASVPVTLVNGSDGAGESGIDSTSGVVERDEVGLSGGSCSLPFPGSWTTVSLSGGNDTTVQSGKCYRYRYKISDKVGNQGTQAGTSSTAKVDTDGPLAPTFAFSALTNAYDNGSGTIFFKGGAAGGFTVTPSASDPQSGTASYAYPALGSGWSNTGGAYTFNSSAADPTEPNNLHGVNNAGLNGTDASFTVTRDLNAPTNMTASITGGYYTSLSIPVTLANGNDGAGESGIDAASGVVERDEVALSNGSCALPFPGSWTTVTLSGGNDTGVQSGKCYRYRYKISDRVGNQGTQSGTSATAKVDNDGPPAPTFAFSALTNTYDNGSGTVYFRGGAAGGFTLSPTASDPQSGTASYSYPALGSGWSNTGGAYTFNSSAADPTEPNNVHGVNNAGLSGADASFTVTRDSNAPTGMTASITGGYYTSSSVPVTLANGSDGAGESGIDPTSGVVERDEVTLSNGSCALPFPGSWTTVTLTGGNDTTVQSGKCYRYRYKISDRVGNQGTQAGTSSTAKVDTSPPGAPTVAFSALTNTYDNGSGTVFFKGGAAGGFTVTPNASDNQSGIGSYNYPALGSGWSNTAGAYSFTSAAVDPSEPNNVVAVNGAGTPGNPTSFTVTKDSNAPTAMSAAITGGYYTSASVPVTLANGNDGGESGVDASSGVVERDESALSLGNCAGFTGSWTTVTLTGGNDTTVQSGKCYRYRYKISDNVGNQGTQAGASATAKVDTTGPDAPTFNFSALTNAYDNGSGTVYYRGGAAGGFTLTPTAHDDQSDVPTYSYPSLGSGWSNGGGAYTFNSSASDPSEPNNVHGINGAGLSGPDTSFTVTQDSSVPTGMSASVAGGYYTSASVAVTLANGSDTGSGLDASTGVVERDEVALSGGSCALPFPGSWTTVTLTGGNDTTVQSGKCYRYRYKISDRVGNQGTQAGTSSTAKVDTSAPSAPTFTFSGLTNASDNGAATLFFRPGASGGFTVTPNATDAQSGIGGYTYPALGSGWSNSGGDYAFNASAADPAEPNNVHAANGAGTPGPDTSFTVTADSAAPTSAIQCNAAACGSGWYTSAPVSATLTANDGAGSGVQEIHYTLDGSDPTILSPLYSTPLSIVASTTVKFRAWDKVGNAEPVESQQIRIDSSAPDVPGVTLSESSSKSFVSGTTLFYNPQGSNAASFSVDATTADPESGIDNVSFPALAGVTGGGADTSTPYSSSYDWTATSSASGSQTVTAHNNAGLTASASFTLTPDTTAPTGMAATVTGGVTNVLSVPVTVAAGSDGAGESGPDSATAVLERDEIPYSNGSCQLPFSGSWTTITLTGGNDTGVQTGKCYRYRASVSDNVGNVGVSAPSATVKVDSTAPSAPNLAFSGLTNAYDDGVGTIYFRGGAGGGFTVVPSAADGQSGISGYSYPALGNGWSNSGGDYTFAPNADDPSEPNNVHAINGAGMPGVDTSFTVTRDSTAPSSSMQCNGGACATGWQTSGSVSVALNATDGGSGVSGIKYTTDGSDPTVGGTTYAGPFDVSTTMTVKWAAYDNVGNVEAVQSETFEIDTTPPPAPGLSYSALTNAVVAAGTVYVRPGTAGGFTVTASSNDPESGTASYGFPALGSGWTSSGSGDARAYAFDASAADPSEPNNVTATNGAGLTSDPTSFAVTLDGNAPTGGSVSYTDGFRNVGSVTVTLDDGTDAGSGVNTSSEVLERSVGTLSGGACTGFTAFAPLATDPSLSYADGSLASGHCYAYRYVVEDRLGNSTTYTSAAVVKVDLDAPTATQGDPGPYMRGTVTLTGTASDTGGSDVDSLAFQRSSDGGASWTTFATQTSAPFSVALDTTTMADGLFDFRTVATDHAGNSAPSTAVTGRRVDNTPPSGSISQPGPYARGVVTLSSTSSDTGGSGIASTSYAFSNDGGATWTPTPASWNTALSGDGIYLVRVVVTDNAGNQATDTSSSFRVDNTPPTATLDDPGQYLRGTVDLTSSSSDPGGSGVDTVDYQRAPAGGSSWTGIPASWDTTGTGDGAYDLRVVVTDRAGNTTNSAPRTNRRVDNTPPTVAIDSPSSNDAVSGTVTISSTADDTGSGLAGPVTYEYRPTGVGPWTATPAAWDTTLLADGSYQLHATAVDRAGNEKLSQVASNVHVDNTPPTVAITAPADGSYVNLASADPATLVAAASDAGTGVAQVEFFQCSDTSAGCTTGTWSSIGVSAAPASYNASWTIPADGSRALRAVATDKAGRTAAAVVDVTVDRTPPDTSIVTQPGDPSNEASPEFTFSSSEDGSFECSLDGAAFAPCTSPDTVGPLTDGTHDFQVRAIDAAGNVDASPDDWSWLADLTPPTATMGDPGVNVRGTVSLTSTQDDPGGANASGVASVAYEFSGDGGTSWASTPSDWDTTAITDGLYKLRVVVLDNAGNQTIDVLPTDVKVDDTMPTTSQDDPGPYLRGTITLTGSAADPDDSAGRPGSGVTQVEFQYSAAGAGSWTTIGTAASGPYSTSLDTTTLGDGRYDFRTVATDAAGNVQASSAVANRLVDNTAPTASMGDPGTNLRGTVTLTSTTGDPGADASGVASVDYELSGGSGWQPAGSTWNTNTPATPDGLYDLRVTVTDRAGNSTTSAPVSNRRVDNTPPDTTDDAPAGYQSSDVTVNLSASDSGSGVSITEYSVDGGGYQAGSSVTIPAPASGANDATHTISYFSADNAGNIEVPKATTVQIDATPPVCPTCTAADYLRGSETLTASPGGSLSGIASVEFQYADAGAPRTNPPAGTWTSIGTDLTAPYSVSWNTTAVADGAYDLRILIKNKANNTSITYLDSRVVDNTAPTAGVGSPPAGALVSGNVTFAATTGDANPIASVEFSVNGSTIATVSSPPFRTTWNTAANSDGSADLQVTVTDIAGNSTTSSSRTVTVDNNAPSPTLGNPGAVVSGTIGLNASSDADTVRVDLQRKLASGGGWTTIASPTSPPFSASLDTTSIADGTYELRAVATDGSGHVGTSPLVTTKVDNTPPSGSLTRPAAGITVGGPAVQLEAAASDATSGVDSVTFQYRPTGGGGFTDIASVGSAPYAYAWDATTLASGSYDLRVLITDKAGNTFADTPTTVSLDSTAPLVMLDDPGSPLSGTVALTAQTSGSPAAQVAFEYSPAGANSWSTISTDGGAPWSASFNTGSVGDGVYDLRAVASDRFGNARASVRGGIRIDNKAPRLISSTPADGSTVASASSISLTASEDLASIAGATLDGAAVAAPILSGPSATFPTGALSEGSHVLKGTLKDGAGKSGAFRIAFTVWSGAGTPPPVQGGVSPTGSTTITSADGSVSVTVPAGAWDDSGADWLVIQIAMVPAPPGVVNDLSFSGNVAQVTAFWALSGVPVRRFLQPITITMQRATNDLVAATSEGGPWRAMRPIPGGGSLPAGWDDGWSADGANVTISTRHLSQFGMARDMTPAAPAPDGGDSGGGSGSGPSSGGSGGNGGGGEGGPRPQGKLAFQVVGTKLFIAGGKVKRIGARIKSTRVATGWCSVETVSGTKVVGWGFTIKPGARVVTFEMPSVIPAGAYLLSWTLDAGDSSASRTTKLTVIRALTRKPSVRTVTSRVDVVLGAQSVRKSALGLGAKLRLLLTNDGADAFDLTGSDKTNVQVVVLPVRNIAELNYLHDLYTVFPTVRLIAISDNPSLRKRALDAGASAAMRRSAAPDSLGKTIGRLALRPF
jgi:large repetitive protein